MNRDILNLFVNYNQSFERLKDLLQDELPRSLRLFNIRLRLAFDIQIDFKGEISLTKTKEVKKTYVLLIKLMEIWNAYEALFHYAKDTKKYVNVKESIYKAYSQTLLNEVGSLTILKNTLDELKKKYDSNKNFKSDFKQLIKRIEDDDRIRPNLTESCKSIVEYFEGNKTISGIEMIALIYAERNMYYHNGETAKMGMRYGNRQFLIGTLTTGFYTFTCNKNY
ncbi:MAG: hypothetical protein QW051_02560 [Candidatus Aenigmatarchaeota archaeon]